MECISTGHGLPVYIFPGILKALQCQAAQSKTRADEEFMLMSKNPLDQNIYEQ